MNKPRSRPEQPATAEPTREPDLQALMQQSRTLGEFMRKVQTPRTLRAVKEITEACRLNAEQSGMIRRHLLRIYSPWPAWVLHTASEIWSVSLPRVRKSTILEVFRAFHWFFFEAAIHGPPTPKPNFDFPPDLPKELLSIWGHSEAHRQALVSEIAQLESEPGSSLVQAEIERIKRTERERYVYAAEAFLRYLATRLPEERAQAMEHVVDAKRATFDQENRIRETTATPIYRLILESWTDIEVMSGPAELCRFLDPVLGVGDFESKLDKVKKLCRRLEIEFHPPVSRDKRGG